MIILGIGGSTHDNSCCLLEDGIINYAIEEERLSKEKYAIGLRSKLFKCIDYCLEANSNTIDDIDLIVANDLLKFPPEFGESFVNKIVRINHHMSHAALAYYTSPFDESTILVIDGSGSSNADQSVETISFGYAKSNSININEKVNSTRITIPDYLDIGYNQFKTPLYSIGGFYTLFTYICGFRLLEDGKTMGLAPYGSDVYLKEIKKYISFDTYNNMQFKLDNEMLFKFIKNEYENNNDKFIVKANLAYAAQKILEDYILDIMNRLYNKIKCKNLCYSGGVALNSVLNGKIFEKTPFENVSIPPASSDSGTAIGAALYAYYNIYKNHYKPSKAPCDFYLGKTYTNDEVRDACLRFEDSIQYEKMESFEFFSRLSQNIADGKIVAWFQEGSESGPRALGNRSIIVDPRKQEMKDYLNDRVKYRESFRPFAPAVLEEYASDYFLIPQKTSPYMLFVAKIKDEKAYCMEATTHIDGTARVQTVNKLHNKKFYRLINSFYKLTGVPILLNTSFNIKGKPIVETPIDAIKTLIDSNIDILAIGDYYVTKK